MALFSANLTVMGQYWQLDNGPVKACTAAFDWSNTGTKRQRSKCVKTRSKVHQLMRINIQLHNMRQVTHFPHAIASLTHFTVHAQYSIAQ